MKYRTQTANVLNEADRYGHILDHQVFVAEQELLLYSAPYEEWRPGDQIHPHPSGNYSVCDYGCHANQDGALALRYDDVRLRECDHRRHHYWADLTGREGYAVGSGNCPRQMIDIIDDTSSSLSRLFDYQPHHECERCDVAWSAVEGTICWSCHISTVPFGPANQTEVIVDSPMSAFWDLTGHRIFEAGVSQGVLYVPESNRGVSWNGLTTITDSDDQRRIYAAFSGDLLETWQASFLTSADAFERFFGTFTEVQDRFLRVFRGEVWRPVARYSPPTNPFEKEAPERIVIPSISDSTPEFFTTPPEEQLWRGRRWHYRIGFPAEMPWRFGSQRPAIPSFVCEYFPEPDWAQIQNQIDATYGSHRVDAMAYSLNAWSDYHRRNNGR